MNDMHIPERFEKAVLLHIMKQFYAPNMFHAPLILGIHGRAGDGKTSQCKTILDRIGAKTIFISGGELENELAGKPAQIIRDRYYEAGQSVLNGDTDFSALVINDIDAGIGNFGGLTQYTVNRQNVCAELMNLCDDPCLVENKRVKRIPIIVTGNDFTKLYEPLVRAGRMSLFEWSMTQEERVNAVLKIFPEFGLSDIIVLVENLDGISMQKNGLSIAFYSHLRAISFEESLWKFVHQFGVQQTLNIFRYGNVPNIKSILDIETLLVCGKQLIATQQMTSHLHKGN